MTNSGQNQKQILERIRTNGNITNLSYPWKRLLITFWNWKNWCGGMNGLPSPRWTSSRNQLVVSQLFKSNLILFWCRWTVKMQGKAQIWVVISTADFSEIETPILAWNKILKKEVDTIFRAGIISPVESTWEILQEFAVLLLNCTVLFMKYWSTETETTGISI